MFLAFAVLALAAAVRAFFFFSLRSTELFRYPFGDALRYLEIAQKIAAEGRLPDGPLFQSALWFSVLEAAVLRAGLGIQMLHALQYLAGFLTVAAVVFLGPALIGRRPALLAGTVLAVYGPGLFLESQLVTAVWAGLFLLLAVLLPLRRVGNPAVSLLLSGVCLGLGIQSQANMAVAAAAFFVGLCLARGALRLSNLSLALFPVGLLVAILPLSVHNARRGDFTPLSTSGGINFFIGNGPQATGLFSLPSGYSLVNDEAQFADSSLVYPSRKLGHAPTPSQASRFWALETLRGIADASARFLALLMTKLRLLLSSWEAPNYFSYRFFSRNIATLPLFGDFGLLLGLALPGLVLFRRDPATRPVLFAAIGYALSVTLFFVTDRYRFPLVPILALAVGVTLTRIPDLGQSTTVRRVLVVAAAALLFIVSRLPTGQPPGREEASSWERVGFLRYQGGDRTGAEEAFTRALVLDPRDEQSLVNLGFLLQASGRRREAAGLYTRALAVNRENAVAWLNLGQLALEEGHPEAALERFEQGLKISPHLAGPHAGRAEALMRMGKSEEALAAIAQSKTMGIGGDDLANVERMIRSKIGAGSVSPAE